jgi:predicted MPP superfamily phosphohydrolase
MKPEKNSKNLKLWKKVSGYSGRNIISQGPPLTVEHAISNEKITGKKIVFFSDLHWQGCEDESAVINAINEQEPDWIVFGGDLIRYTCNIAPAMKLLEQLKAKELKLAVSGNWDRRTRRWFPRRKWFEYYKASGFKLLVNEGAESKGVYFYGLDDFKTGNPHFGDFPKDTFNVLISHNPDAPITLSSDKDMECIDLILSGHTHAGQIRIPAFGAFITSSIYWKKFEYGRFQNKKHKTEMIVSSGIGMTGVPPIRLFSHPEIIVAPLAGGGR